MTDEKPKLWRVSFRSSFRSGNAECISHVSVDGSYTLCGRRLKDAEEIVVDNEAVPDCRACARPAAIARMRARSLCAICRAGETAGEVVDRQPAHKLWRMLKGGEMEAILVPCQAEVARIAAMLTHPALLGVDYAALIGVRPLEDGRFEVWWLYEPGDDREDAEFICFDDPYRAAEAFIQWRIEMKLGHDFETEGEAT